MDVTDTYLRRALNLIWGEEFSLSSSEEGSFLLHVFSSYLCSVLRSQKLLRVPECLPCHKVPGSGWALQPHKMQMTRLCF